MCSKHCADFSHMMAEDMFIIIHFRWRASCEQTQSGCVQEYSEFSDEAPFVLEYASLSPGDLRPFLGNIGLIDENTSQDKRACSLDQPIIFKLPINDERLAHRFPPPPLLTQELLLLLTQKKKKRFREDVEWAGTLFTPRLVINAGWTQGHIENIRSLWAPIPLNVRGCVGVDVKHHIVFVIRFWTLLTTLQPPDTYVCQQKGELEAGFTLMRCIACDSRWPVPMGRVCAAGQLGWSKLCILC